MKLRLAHSPDSDDAFMFWALAEGLVDTEGLVYEHELSDIESLNRRALAGELEITAVSFHAYAHLSDRYVLLPHGASFGEGYGPIVVCRAERPLSRESLAGRKIAIPGELTTAALALRLWFPEAETVVMAFDAVGPAVLAGKVDAGVLIHEGQLTWQDEGLFLVEDLGRWWHAETGLPLPLGGNVVRKDLGPEVIGKVRRALGKSIDLGLERRPEALAHAARYSRGLDPAKTDRFVGMYVNRWTQDYGERGRSAVQLLLDRGAEAGILPRITAEFV